MSNLNWVVWRHKSMADISPKYSSNHEELSAEEVPKVVLIEVTSNNRTQRTFEKPKRKPTVQFEFYPEYTKVL